MDSTQLIASILKASSPPPIRLEVEGLEHPVYIRKMSGYDGAIFAKQMAPFQTDDPLYSGRLLACLIVDEQGKQLFSEANDEHVAGLAKLPKDIQWAIAGAHSEHNTSKAESSKP